MYFFLLFFFFFFRFENFLERNGSFLFKKLLAEKELQAAKDLAFQLPIDHEEAIKMDKFFDFERDELLKAQKERDDEIARKASEDAEIRAKKAIEDKIQAEKQAVIDIENAAIKAREDEIKKQNDLKEKEAAELEKLEANKSHVSKILGQAKESLITLGIDETQAKKIVKAIAKGQVAKVSISYSK